MKKSRESLRNIIGHNLLDNNRCVALLIDQYGTGDRKSIDVPVFSTPAPPRVGCVKSALEFDSPIVMVVCVYEGDKCRIIVYPPFKVEKKETEKETYLFWLAELNKMLEDLIRRYPEQWAWGYRRYHHRNYKIKKK